MSNKQDVDDGLKLTAGECKYMFIICHAINITAQALNG
jgi:hypothetical protein